MINSIFLIFGALASFLSLLICFKHLFSKHIVHYLIPTFLSLIFLLINLYFLYIDPKNKIVQYSHIIFLSSLLFYVSNLIQHHLFKVKTKKNKSKKAMLLKEKEALHIEQMEREQHKKALVQERLEAMYGYTKPKIYSDVIVFD